MDSLARSFVDRVRSSLSKTKDLSRLADWMRSTTRHPKFVSKPWSFAEHEFQIDIVNDSHNDVVIKKCAQVGLSEVSVRMTLGLIDIHPNSTAIYTLPTSGFAMVFAKSRFDPVIADAPDLREKVDRDTDSTSLKKIGGSFLHIRGTFTQTAAISVPADILVHDEIDFSDQITLSSFTSRLGHVKEEDIIRRRFSTPTVSGYGVSLLFDDSTQNYYSVKCQHCETWQIPLFDRDTVLPGYDRRILDLEKEDLTDHRYKFDEAYLKCPGCGKMLTVQNLADKDRRQWVASHPDKVRAGYQVQPFDVPTINTVSRTLRAIDDFKRKVDWVNFKVGKDYQDADTSFVKVAVERAFCLKWAEPRPLASSSTVIGIDVGKTSWISVCRPNELKGLDVIHYERVKLTSKEVLPDRAKELFDWYGCQMLVIDAGPEWTQALGVIEKLPANKAYACYYKGRSNSKMSFIEPDEEERVVKVDRSAIISDVAKKVNTGVHRFARCADQETYKAHLDNLKKINKPNSKGQDTEVWVNNGPDHYGHTLFFASAASELLSYRPKTVVVPALPMPVKAKIGGLRDRGVSYHDRP